ncbi:MAG: efflux transporter outer membrane subunit [Prosthecobacter sp.]|nr:efflux transporter outer membrane subunit [Prosthecobacter sp.]
MTSTPLLRLIFLPAAAILLSGCDLAPRPGERAAPPLPQDFQTHGPWRTARPADAAERGDWWHLFRDSRLSALMQEAEQHSPTLEITRQRVLEARALARADRAGFFPNATLRHSAQRDRATGSMQFQFAGGRTRNTLLNVLDLQYEIDFWGRVRNQARAGAARGDAAEADLQNARLGLLSELAMNYYALRLQDAQLALLRRTVSVRQRTVELARKRFAQGDVAQVDVAQAETDLAETQAEAIGLERDRAELEHAIALLLGKVPGELTLPALPLTGQPPALPRALPSTLLERRPDIAAAEREMAALNAEIGVARAAYFPSITLGVRGGTQTSFYELMDNRSSHVWGLGPAAVEWPLLRGGRVRAGYVAAKARYEQGTARYRQTVLNAMREVEDALSGLEVLRRQSAAQDATVAAAARALELSQKRYESGLVAYFEVLDAQRTLLRAEREATRLQGQLYLATVMLVKALGGGW